MVLLGQGEMLPRRDREHSDSGTITATNNQQLTTEPGTKASVVVIGDFMET